ncbi:NAD-dependent epimerase/dehydratase family protein [Tropicibacter naphthalenivorans]|uniref:4-carboxy-2-hydroxymuconate-6-semialdehyde dehydrogenase n=1 Tax=Tropicibacter naphthalenivorans TaxID=441103 RepID=A0A0P1GVF8_9RHOB|nr:NAD-dependent epimerase/dehydratase family protein [Tropicibacter naphthalenivorans]CUH79414.1 4-carboxy-2-hydroxymuconate-6-semialdehyde dehydrogenase [Tropicibacter naphthalenivorans]SMC72069.1 Predicted dehydrogenase [Tropicibacter naphthalenivorans]
MSETMSETGSEIRVGLIGAGYIATWHADALSATPGVRITAIVDPNESAAQGMAHAYGARAFTSVEEMFAANCCDCVHILTPPHLHEEIAVNCLNAGLHVLVEKPVSESADATRNIQSAADSAGKRFHAGHNFLGLPSYTRMKAAMQSGDYGRISGCEVTWALPLAPLRSGPYNLWLLREPKNLLLELGPHLVAFAQDLFGDIQMMRAEASKPALLPGDDPRPQYIRLLAQAGGVEVTFTISMVETVDDRSVTLRGSSARARLDFAQDVLIVERENPSDLIVNPLRKQLDLSRQHLWQGAKNAAVQLKSLNTQNPYGRSFRGMDAAIYGDLSANKPQDARFSGASAVKVMQAIDDAIALLPAEVLTVKAPAVQTRQPKPTAMVIGGTGFIGRALTRRLVADGRDVRVLSRGRSGPFPDLPDNIETVQASLHDLDALTEAMKGIDVVFNLAKALETTWADALKNDVGVATRIGMACEKAGVKRLVYTGTIASYDMSDPGQQITEDTGFPEDMTDRNLYARSKAECEKQLLKLHRERGLPVVIARPGIVVGAGGPLQHWGIGRWHGAGAVRIWGHGRNILPFVLNEDIADGLVRMIDAPVEGQSFNLIGEPMLSARDYFDAIHAELGARIRFAPGNLYAFYAGDALKYALKKYALRRKGVIRPSLADWKSRAHFSPFVNTKPKEMLGWQPETDRATFVQKAITQANLMGF